MKKVFLIAVFLCAGSLHAKTKKPQIVLRDVPLMGQNHKSPVVKPEIKKDFERQAVAACLVLEAGGDKSRGMEAVAHVISNRSAAKNKSFYSVVTQKGQFSTMFRGPGAAIQKAKSKNFAAAYPLALAIYDRMKNKTLGVDFTNGAQYFESYKKNPLFFRRLQKTLTVGGNSFYKAKK